MASALGCVYNCRGYAGDVAWIRLASQNPHAHHPACPSLRGAHVGDLDDKWKLLHDPGQYIYDKLSDRSSRESKALREVVRGEMIDGVLQGVAAWLLWEVLGDE